MVPKLLADSAVVVRESGTSSTLCFPGASLESPSWVHISLGFLGTQLGQP